MGMDGTVALPTRLRGHGTGEDVDMNWRHLARAGTACALLTLGACGHTAGERALSGGAIGAGAGAAIGAASGGSAATGAAIGGAVGAVSGAATTPQHDRYRRDVCDRGPDYWDRHGGPRAYHRECD